jgi:hypothetical protein
MSMKVTFSLNSNKEITGAPNFYLRPGDSVANTRQLSERKGIRWNTIDDIAKNKAKVWSRENLDKKALELTDADELIEYVSEQRE